jgi:hypothetical protein
MFTNKRVNPKREFFVVAVKAAACEMKRYELEDVTPEQREQFDSPLLKSERIARRQVRLEAAEADPSIAEFKNLHKSVRVRKKRT